MHHTIKAPTVPRPGRLAPVGRALKASWKWLQACFAPGAERPAMRAGLLDSGELVLVDAHGRAQTFSAATTDLIRRTVNTRTQALTWPTLPTSGEVQP